MKNKKELLNELRQFTNNTVSLAECLNSLKESDDDLNNAKELLERKGLINKRQVPLTSLIPKDAPIRWAYILTKVNLYLKKGPDVYRNQDTFVMPHKDIDSEVIEEIEACFKQFMEGKCYSKNNPVENISVGDFYESTNILHFNIVSQSSSSGNDSYLIDDMLFEHIMDKRKIRLLNKISTEHYQEAR